MKRRIAFIILMCFAFSCFTVSGTAEESKKIALTFDDGPHPRYTEKILDILSEYGVTATFFVIGINAENYPESLLKLAESGCEIGNHTYSHKKLSKLNEAEIIKEISECEKSIYRITGKRPVVFRPPGGSAPSCLEKITADLGYNTVLWSIDTLDWSLNPSEKICAVVSHCKSGDIILMHDYVSGGNTTCEALRQFIPVLLARGYEFVSISELLA